jgi:hypothetical protein
MNSTTTCSDNTRLTQYANLGIAGLAFIANAILLLLKKDGMLDRLRPREKPRNPTLRKLHDVDTRLGHITIQLTNLTPPGSVDNDERLHSSTGICSDRGGDSGEDVQRLRLCEEGRADQQIQQQASAILEEPRGQSSGGVKRTEPRRRDSEAQFVRDAHTRRDQVTHGSSSRTSSTSGLDQPSGRQALRSSGAPKHL